MKAIKFINHILIVSVCLFCAYQPTLAAEKHSLLKIFSNNSTKKNVNQNYKTFHEALNIVESEYIKDLSEKKLIEAAIEGMLTSLDPYSTFLDEQTMLDMINHTKGEFSGIAVEITTDKGYLKVISPYLEGPAFKAGIKEGDIITAINGESVQGLSLSEAAAKLRGKAGTKITLNIIRNEGNKSSELSITLVRDIIKITPVSAKRIKGALYFKVSNFNAQTTKTIEKLYKQFFIPRQIKGIILDMRWNPGGLFDQALDVSNLFLPNGKLIVSVMGRDASSQQSFYSDKQDITKGLPIIILVNGGTASAPEIVVGALKNNQRAIVLGTKTFGKGSMQSIIPLSNTTAIKLTTARYYTPDGNCIDGIGIEPDIILENNNHYSKSIKSNNIKSDLQLQRALSLINNEYFYHHFSKENK